MDPRTPNTPQYDQPSTSQVHPPYLPGQHVQRPPYPPPQFAGTPGRFNQVHSWHQNHFDSGIQSMTASQNPSVMSYAGSEMSMNSIMSEGPPNNLNEQALARIERVKRFFTGGDPQKSKEAINELLKLLDDSEEEVVEKSIDMLKNVARSDNWRPPQAPAIIDKGDVVFAVKQTLFRYKNNKYIVRCCFCILFFTPEHFLVPLIKQFKEEMLDILIGGITVTEFSTYKYALMVIHSLIHQKEVGPSVVQYLRDQKALGFIAEWLSEPSIRDKLISIIVDTVHNICNKNEEQRSFFVVNLYGIQKLVKILAERNYNPLVTNVTKLLHSIAASDGIQAVYSPQIVEAGIFNIVSRLFTPNLDGITLIFLLKLICSLSDIPPNSDIRPLLGHLVHLIGHNDLKIKQLCVDSLSNFIANKADLKDFVAQQQAVPILVQLMEQMDAAVVENKLTIEKIQESALTVLSHLCSQHPHAPGIISYIPQTSLRCILLKKLTELRPAVLKPTLILISKLASESRNISILKSTSIQFMGEHWYIPAICNVLGISMTQIDMTVEGIRIHTLARTALDALTNLSKDKSVAEIVLKMFIEKSENNGIWPTVLLMKESPEDLKTVKMASLKLLTEIAGCVPGAKYICGNEIVQESLGHVKNSEIEDLVKLADQVLQKAAETSRNPPPLPYRQDRTVMSPEQIYRENETFYSSPYPSIRGPHSYPSVYPGHQTSSYPPFGGGNGYSYPPPGPPGYSNCQLPYPSDPGSCYESQPMSIEPAMVHVGDGPKHEELAYMTPMEEVQCHSYIPPQSAPDQEYSIPGPQPSPFQVNGMESMSWTTWDNP